MIAQLVRIHASYVLSFLKGGWNRSTIVMGRVLLLKAKELVFIKKTEAFKITPADIKAIDYLTWKGF
jgi:hypothetical protein